MGKVSEVSHPDNGYSAVTEQIRVKAASRVCYLMGMNIEKIRILEMDNSLVSRKLTAVLQNRYIICNLKILIHH
jgi:hypothetical protein